MALSGSLTFLSAGSGSQNIDVDFVGLNTVVVDPLTASSNSLGYPTDGPAASYINSSI